MVEPGESLSSSGATLLAALIVAVIGVIYGLFTWLLEQNVKSATKTKATHLITGGTEFAKRIYVVERVFIEIIN